MRTSQHGNTLALMAAALGALVFLIAMFVLFYNQTIGTHKQAMSAIDSAALEAAKDMSRIVVDGPLGRMALVDDPSGDSPYPVLGINTVAATLRIDAIIANKLGNTTMLYLVDNDATLLSKATDLLQKRILSSASSDSGAFDKHGKPVTIKSDAYNAYVNNSVRMSGTSKPPEKFAIAIGAFVGTGNGTTQVPTPSPANLDDTNYTNNNSYMVGSVRYYRPNFAFPLAGLTKTVSFAAVGSSPTLASAADFGALSASAAPVLAQVSCDQPIVDVTRRNNTSQVMHVVSTAQVGGRSMTSGNSSALNVGFNGGFPEDTPAISFKSVKSIMNASQIAPGQTDPSSPYTGWDKGSKGTWYVPQGGDFGGSVSNNVNSLTARPFKGIGGKSNNDDPSVALSFVVYDWLKTLGTRPNMRSVIDALSYDLKANPPSSPKIFTSSNQLFMQPVYAAAANNCAASTPVLTVYPGMAGDDPRSLENFYKDPVAYERQQINMWKYTPADGNIKPTALMALKDCNGQLKTADGFHILNLQFFLRDLIYTDWVACEQYNRAITVMDNGVKNDSVVKQLNGQIDTLKKRLNQGTSTQADIDVVEAQLTKAKFEAMGRYFDNNPYVFSTIVNTTYMMEVCYTIVQNMKVLTGNGVHSVPPVSVWVPYEQLGHYILAGADFYPKTFNYNLVGIHPGPISVGPNYLGNLVKNENGMAVSQINIYKRTSEPIIGERIQIESHDYLQPVLAQSSQPPFSLFSFSFQVANPTAGSGEQNVQIAQVPADRYATVPTPKGQYLYQNLTAFGDTPAGNCVPRVLYQVQAKDLAASAYPETSTEQASKPGDAAHYFTEYGEHPNLSAAWSVSCPIVQPNVECWMPKLQLTYHGFYHGIAGEKAVTIQQVSEGTNAQAICAPFFGSAVDPSGFTVHTKWGDFKSRTFIETTYCVPFPLPWHT
ncbi:MAG: hypothetical protein K2Y22_11550 [Candidatus Obscuribacterales bacterium]|nr:hypothetical protein [Candidatus Obscuribacterales bacterium]